MDKEVKKDEGEEGKTAGNARSQARQQKRVSRGRVTGGRDELWKAEQTWTDWTLRPGRIRLDPLG